MKKRLVALAAAVSLALGACGAAASFTTVMDDAGVHVVATGGASDTGEGTIEIEEGFGLCVNHIVNSGSFHVTATDAEGKVVFDKEVTDNIADLVDVDGTIELSIAGNAADGTVDVIAYDKEAQAEADAALAEEAQKDPVVSEIALKTQTDE